MYPECLTYLSLMYKMEKKQGIAKAVSVIVVVAAADADAVN